MEQKGSFGFRQLINLELRDSHCLITYELLLSLSA